MIESPILFDPGPHTYTNLHTGDIYNSVSSVIGLFKNEFVPTPNKTNKLRTKNGWSHEQVLAHWKRVNLISQLRGTFVHKCLEDFLNEDHLILQHGLSQCENQDLCEINDKGEIIPNTDFKEHILNYLAFAKSLNLKRRGSLFFCEFVLWLEEMMLAGTPDLLALTYDGIYIGDWKTNKKFTKYSPFKQYLKGPLSHLHDCHLNTYTIQLNIYAYMASLIFKMPVHKLEIYHLKKGKVETIPIEYNKARTEMILEYYQKQTLIAA